MDISAATPAELADELLSREDFYGAVVTVEPGTGGELDQATAEFSATLSASPV